MKVHFFLISTALLLSACAPMPNSSRLFPKITHLTELKDIDLTINELSLGETLWKCNKLAFEVNSFLPVLSCGFIPACGVAYHDGNGGIEKCEVWVPKGDKYALKHELLQCQGMADKWY